MTFWTRRSSGANQSDIGVWAAPVLGGPARPYLEGVAEFDWSSDGTRLVYHTPGPGDPMFVRDRDAGARQIFSAAPGLHGHFPIWSPDQSFIYFVQGGLPDRMDVWRIRPSGGAPERVTNHDSRVSHPAFLDARTLLYLVADSDGSERSLYRVDVLRPKPQRVTFGVERYTSLAMSSDGRRLVATMSRPSGALWRLPVNETGVDSSAAVRISLTTGNGFAPRMGPDFLVYVTSRGESDSMWKLQRGVATELWGVPESRIMGAPASRVTEVASRLSPGITDRPYCMSRMRTARMLESSRRRCRCGVLRLGRRTDNLLPWERWSTKSRTFSACRSTGVRRSRSFTSIPLTRCGRPTVLSWCNRDQISGRRSRLKRLPRVRARARRRS